MTSKHCSLSELAREIPGLPEKGRDRLAALRQALKGRAAPAALGVRQSRRPVKPVSGNPVVRMTEDEAAALPTAIRYFDRDWYVRTYRDVRQSNIAPAEHFRRIGWKEGRNPNQFFDTNAYLAANPDVAALRVNPFEHFIFQGVSEKRRLAPS